MRTLAIGDIHGCIRALTTLVEYADVTLGDRLIALGDYVDRGPNTRAVLDWLVKRQEEGLLIPLRGNHELMMLAARRNRGRLEDWLQCGGDAALESYGTRATLEDVPDDHWTFLESCRPYYEAAEHFFVHANAVPDLPLEEQPDFSLYWEFFNNPRPHVSQKTMVCGHTPQRVGRPLNLGHAVCIDTCACHQGWLTCLEPATGRYWQTNEMGQTRSGIL